VPRTIAMGVSLFGALCPLPMSLTYKVLTTTQPPYLLTLISIQRPRSTRSSSVVALARPPLSSSLKITDRSFRYASFCLWNQLRLSLRKLYSGTSSSVSYSPLPSPITSSSSDSPLCTSITPSLFHSRLKTLTKVQYVMYFRFCNGANQPESKTMRMFRQVRQVSTEGMNLRMQACCVCCT